MGLEEAGGKGPQWHHLTCPGRQTGRRPRAAGTRGVAQRARQQGTQGQHGAQQGSAAPGPGQCPAPRNGASHSSVGVSHSCCQRLLPGAAVSSGQASMPSGPYRPVGGHIRTSPGNGPRRRDSPPARACGSALPKPGRDPQILPHDSQGLRALQTLPPRSEPTTVLKRTPARLPTRPTSRDSRDTKPQPPTQPSGPGPHCPYTSVCRAGR